MKKVCNTCGKDYLKIPKHSRKEWEARRFCCRRCAYDAMKGKPAVNFTPEVRLKMSKALTGRKHTLETRKRISEGHKGMPAHNKGVRMAEEQKEKLRAHMLAHPHRYWLGKKRPSMTGPKCPWWKGGISTPERKRYLNLQRFLRKKNIEGSHTYEEWLLLKAFYNYMCLCCKKQEPEIKLSEDHIVPISKGGTDYINNIQPLCRSCNSSKHVKSTNYIEIYAN